MKKALFEELKQSVREAGKIRRAPAVQLKAYRVRLGLSQSKAAAKLGIKKRTLQAWEIGYRTPNPWLWAVVEPKLKGKT